MTPARGKGWSLMSFCARAPRTMKRIGRSPTLVLCSRNARPEQGLGRRPHVDQHACPSKGGDVSELGRII
jgi:hypothetical protein